MASLQQLISGDTIVALSTAQGVGAIGVIRLSGPDAIGITNKVFHGKDLSAQATHTLHFGTLRNGETVIDEVVVALFKEPHSYTKEHVVEISCHGSPYIQQQIIDLMIDNGARPAQRGEFTMRAFLNGRMDLSQAEAVADLIASDSASSHRVAMQQMRGGFSNKIKELRDKLVHFASMIELELDFGEEDVQFADRDDLKQLIEELKDIIGRLIYSFKLGNVIKNGVSTVIAGRPNAGKSTLLNRLLQEERAIVSDIPGTTRDTIEETLNIGGVLFRLVDTAGIRDASDAIEKIGVEKTMQQISRSALVIYLFDVVEMDQETLQQDIERLQAGGIPLILVGNKVDLLADDPADKFDTEKPMVFISSKEDKHIGDLENALIHAATGGKLNEDQTIVTNARHYESLLQTQNSLNDVLNGLANNITGDFLALDIRRSLHSLGEITGEITTDDLLDNIFSKFCIGK